MSVLSSIAGGLRARRRRLVDDLDLGDEQLCQDPFPLYARLRAEASVHHRRRDDQWFVFGYDDVATAFMRPQTFSSQPMAVYDPHILGADPPAHSTTRRVLTRELAAILPGVPGVVEPIATELLASLSRQAEFDAIDDFIRPLGDAVAGRILGFTDDHVRAISAAVGKGRAEIATGFNNAVPAVEQALRDTGPPSWMPPLPAGHSLRQLAEFGRFIWTASTRTSRQTFSNCLLALLQFPSVREQVSANPDLVPNLVEEVVRLDPGEHLLIRQTTTDAELTSARIPQGATVMLCLASANRDPARFEQPDVLSLQRTPNPHLGFGKGHHKCPGANIARAQVVAGLRVWLNTLPQFRAVEPLSSAHYLGGPSMRMLERLMVSGQ